MLYECAATHLLAAADESIARKNEELGWRQYPHKGRVIYHHWFLNGVPAQAIIETCAIFMPTITLSQPLPFTPFAIKVFRNMSAFEVKTTISYSLIAL